MATYHFEEKSGLSVSDSKYVDGTFTEIVLDDIGGFDITNKTTSGEIKDYYFLKPDLVTTGSAIQNKIKARAEGVLPSSKNLAATLEILYKDNIYPAIRLFNTWPMNASTGAYVLGNQEFELSSLFDSILSLGMLSECPIYIDSITIGVQYFTNLDEFEFGQDLQAVYQYQSVTLENDQKTFLKDENGIWQPGLLYAKQGSGWKRVIEIYEKNEANSIQWERKV